MPNGVELGEGSDVDQPVVVIVVIDGGLGVNGVVAVAARQRRREREGGDKQRDCDTGRRAKPARAV